LKRILFVGAMLLFHASFVFAKFNPSFTWSTFETRHFLIHYHQGEEDIAKRAAVIAEDVHDRLTPRVKWAPQDKTRLVLVDSTDASNGLTTTFPFNSITLFITPPPGEPGFGTTAYDEWLRLLITHEYTHVLQLDMAAGGLGKAMRTIFGRIYFPNALEPIWMIEGLAVYEETEQTTGGRGRSPGAEMIIRTAVLEDRFPRLKQAAVFPDLWPAGETPYLFGEGFIRYLSGKYGRDKVADISVAYSGRGFPFLVGSTGERVLKEEYGELWDEWLMELRSRYLRLRSELAAQGLTVSMALTKRGWFNGFPAFSPDGKLIAYMTANEDEFPGIFVMNADGTGDRKLAENTTSSTSSGGGLAWSPDGGRIYHTKFDVQENVNVYNDLYYFDLRKKKEVRVTRALRARDPCPSPDGRKLLFVTNKLGRTRLAVLELSAIENGPAGEKDVAYLTEESMNQYETPRYSPDGGMITVGVRQPGGYKDIWILDAGGNKTEELMHDRAVDGGAVWSPDGKRIYFSSDRTGIFNLYAWERESKNVFQATNVLGGAFSPAPSPDGKTLAFVSYSSKGYDIDRMPAEPAQWKAATAYRDPYPVMTYVEKPVETSARPYNPLPTLAPRFWLPWFGYSEESGSLFGFLTYSRDAVERHQYLLTALHGPASHRSWYSFQYAYDGFYPTVRFAAFDVDGTFSGLLTDSTGTRNYTEREKTIDASLVFPFLSMRDQHEFIIGYRRRDISRLTALPPGYLGAPPSEGALISGRARYIFNNAMHYGNAISPEDGRTVEIGAERLDKALGGDFAVTKYTADWREYADLPWKHHVLLARGFAGTSSGDVLPQRAFQLGGDNPGDITIPVDDEFVYLRGYPVNEFRGRNAALASLEYRFPVTSIDSGADNGPLYMRKLHGAVFAEAGNAWDDRLRLRDFKRAVGVEGRLDVYLAYSLPVTFRYVVAKGLDEKRELYVYLWFWAPALF
jgi:Tol biopolymer transport system component